MNRFETKVLTRDAAMAVLDNFRWFAGFRATVRELGPDRYSVRTYRWCWSHVVLLEEDYA